MTTAFPSLPGKQRLGCIEWETGWEGGRLTSSEDMSSIMSIVSFTACRFGSVVPGAGIVILLGRRESVRLGILGSPFLLETRFFTRCCQEGREWRCLYYARLMSRDGLGDDYRMVGSNLRRTVKVVQDVQYCGSSARVYLYPHYSPAPPPPRTQAITATVYTKCLQHSF